MSSKLTYRTLETDSIDIENRLVYLSFSSEAPYPREFGIEILSHDPQHADLSLAAQGIVPVLLDHNPEDQIGIVESAWIENRRGQAIVRFSKNEKADEVFQDVVDGIRKTISAGYVITGMKKVKGPDGREAVLCSWKLREISFTSVPADTTVGVGRSDSFAMDEEERKRLKDMADTAEHLNAVENVQNDDDLNKTNADDSVTDQMQGAYHTDGANVMKGDEVVHVADNESEALEIASKLNSDRVESPVGSQSKADETPLEETEEKSEQKQTHRRFIQMDQNEVVGILELCQRHGKNAAEFIQRGATLDQVRAEILDGMQTKSVELGLTRKERESFSLGRAAKAAYAQDWSNAGFEREVCVAAARADGKTIGAKSIYLPQDILTRDASANAMNATNGAGYIDVETRIENTIQAAYGKTLASKIGVQFFPNLVGDLEIPAMGNVTVNWVGDGISGALSANPAKAPVRFSPKSVIGLAEVTRNMFLQTDGLVTRFIENAIRMALVEAIDKAVFSVGSASSPNGLAGVTFATKTAAVGGVTPISHANLRSFIRAVQNANRDSDRAVFVCNPNVMEILESTKVGENTIAQYLADRYADKIEVSTNVGNKLVYGDFSNIAIGQWGGLELAVDESTHFTSGGMVLRVIASADVKPLDVTAFAGYNDILVG